MTGRLHRLDIDGMDCPACEQLLTEHVGRVEGVLASFADARTGALTLLCEPSVVMDQLAGAVVTAGFAQADVHRLWPPPRTGD